MPTCSSWFHSLSSSCKALAAPQPFVPLLLACQPVQRRPLGIDLGPGVDLGPEAVVGSLLREGRQCAARRPGLGDRKGAGQGKKGSNKDY